MTTKQDIIAQFDPSTVGVDNGQLFGFPFDYDTADIIVIGVPWEVTVSYRTGTAQGPASILQASPQLDFYDWDNPEGWQQGIFMPPLDETLVQENHQLRQQAQVVIAAAERGVAIDAIAAPNPKTGDNEQLTLRQHLAAINAGCDRLNQWVYQHTANALDQGKRVIIVGGDHSVPLGGLQALGDRYPNFGILHIDAHADLRERYEGFQYSHASIMFNALAIPQLTRLVQVGVRDVSQPEVELIQQSHPRIITHFDPALKQEQYAGTPWRDQCQRIVEDLPQHVYLSLDIDGLDPKLCPHTGTPVPGGLELEEVFCLLREVVRSDRTIIGADLCEVGPGEWDGNVGARIVYKLCMLMGLSS